MAWVSGLASKEEIKVLERAGWEIEKNLNLGDLQPSLDPPKGDTMISVWTECDVTDLLSLDTE